MIKGKVCLKEQCTQKYKSCHLTPLMFQIQIRTYLNFTNYVFFNAT